MVRYVLPCLAASLVLAACSPSAPPSAPEHGAAEVVAVPASHGFGPEVSAEDFSVHVRTLASDEFAGRAPGSAGEQLTVQYIQSQFERLGLKPGNGDSYLQTVPMVESEVDPSAHLAMQVKGEALDFAFGSDMVIGSRTEQATVAIENSPLVFVGYGVNAPEQGWNDYAGLDVKGKTVVMLVNDPGFHAGDETLFDGKRMTYYGRWTYKFEEAARQGASAALIIHDDAGAGYGWAVVQNSWSGKQFDLPRTVDTEPRSPAQGWLTGDAAKRLFAAAGLDLDALRTAANQRGFKAVPLDATLTTALDTRLQQTQSHNVLGLLPGSTRPDESVVYMAHWDHLGTHEGEAGDNIYNGAIDNASGVAGILEIAEAFVTQNPAPERSVLFLAVTLEESGLLGSRYYTAQPVLPLAKTAAVINLDAMPVLGPTRDMVVIGKGNSELEDLLAEIAGKQGRTLVAEDAPEKGYYFRSDHFNFAKAGVPALYAKGGTDNIEHGKEFVVQATQDYLLNRYHKPADAFDPNWDLRGVVQDINALYAVGRVIAGSGQWPNWYEGNAFRAARELGEAERATP
ncbi:MAG: aminopeptidase [Gammaproteobacteria bacterium HGW-Gammaproteobacteria-4]|jgi:Zn-dependent M28 family amino/carboxypeptidase|nr:MAG: aminopeptidase [Gammaproteobacteria bacterium HGW-Gammaproteobacteria-4]